MKKIFTILMSMLTISAFAATEPTWYNDVTSITANGQYYIYSVKGAGFVQAANEKVKTVTANNYTANSDLLFTITKAEDGRAYNGSSYLSSYQAGTCGPTGTSSNDGSNLEWTLMDNGKYWNIHGKYTFSIFGTKYAALYYKDGGYAATADIWGNKDTQTGTEYQWYLISPAQYDRHWAIYNFDKYKEGKDITPYAGLVPTAYYNAVAAYLATTYDVKDASVSAEQIRNAQTALKAMWDELADIQTAYANAKEAIKNLEDVEDKGEDFAEVTADITAARAAIDEATTVAAVNAAVAGLKAIDPITFNVTDFTALTSVSNAASSVAGRTISYAAENTAIIDGGKAIYAGTTTLTATAAATDAYYKFVRSAQVTVTAWDTYGDFEQTSCDEAVEFNGQNYEESFAGDVTVGKNYIGGDSIVHVKIVINHSNTATDEKTMTFGDDEEWNGIALKDSTVGVHTVVYVTTNVAGCDSTVTLTLTVNKMENDTVLVPLSFCEGGSEWYRGVEYTEAGNDTIEAEGATRDTVYVVTITELKKSFEESFEEVTEGEVLTLEEGAWYKTSESAPDPEWIEPGDYEMNEIGSFDLTLTTTNVAGCDSVVVRHITVNPKQGGGLAIDQTFVAPQAVKEFRNGVLYIRRGEKVYGIDGRLVK